MNFDFFEKKYKNNYPVSYYDESIDVYAIGLMMLYHERDENLKNFDTKHQFSMCFKHMLIL